MNKGVALSNMKQMEEANEVFNQALEIYEKDDETKEKYKQDIAMVHGNLGNVHDHLIIDEQKKSATLMKKHILQSSSSSTFLIRRVVMSCCTISGTLASCLTFEV